MAIDKLIRDLIATQAEINGKERRAGLPRKERRRRNREAQLPNPRVCPTCGETKPRSRQWIILPDIVQCKSCHMKGKSNV